MKVKFALQNYNEFKDGLRWHDYISIIINEFPIFVIRRYDWLTDNPVTSTYMVQILGFNFKR
jgi:hypothetical protein